MRRTYSRLASTEEKRNVKTATRFVILTIVVIGFLFFFGIPLLGKFAGFISDLGKSQKPIGINDKTPPAPPQLNNLPEFTNQKEVKLTGKSEEGATVKLSFNSKDEEVVAGRNGDFSFDLKLNNGENLFDAIATDAAGNESQKTKTFKITFDNEKPELTIESPSDGTSFFGSRQRQIEIKGKTDTGSEVTINDRFVSVEESGNFQYTTTLNEGENKFNIKSTDKAGNLTETELTFTFTS